MPLDPNTLIPSSGVIFGSWCQTRFPEDSGASLEQIHYNFENRIGRKLHIVGTYQHFDDWTTTFPGSFQQNWANGGRLLFFRWKPDQAPGTARWQAIADGVYDSYIDGVFTRMMNWGGGTGTNAIDTNRFFLAPHHEFDGNDYQTWGEPGDTVAQAMARYRAAFIHIKARRDAIGATNALLCWIVTGGSSTNQSKWLPAYPGDANVDYIGFEPYNSWNCLSGLNWRWPTENWQTFLNWAEANAPTPPIMLGEFGVTEHIDPNNGAFLSPSKAEWFQDGVQGVIPTLKKAPYNRIKNVNYFHSAPSCQNWWDTTTASFNAAVVMANDPFLFPDMSVGSGGAGGAGTITFVGAVGTNNNATTTAVTSPAGISNGDAMVASAVCSNARTMTAPGGWTVYPGFPQDGGSCRFYVWTKDTVVSGDSSTLFTWTNDAANKVCLELGVWHSTNGFPASYLDDLTFLAQDATDTTFTAPQITSTTDNSWGVALFGVRGTEPTPWTAATGLTERQDQDGASSGATALHLCDSNDSVGASGTNWGAFNETNISSSNGGGISFFLKPNVTAGGGGGTSALIFRDAATGSHASSATPTVTVPATTVTGDIIIAGFTTSTITPTVTADPASYNVNIRDHTNQRTRIYTKIAAGTPGAVSSDASTTIGPTLSTTGSKTTLFCVVYANPHGTAPIEAINSAVELITQASHMTPAVSTITNGCWVVNVWMDRGIAAGNTTIWTPPAGETKRAERYETGTSASTLIVSDGAQANSPGNYGQKTANSDLATSNAVMWTIAIAPAVAAGGGAAQQRPGPIPIN